MFLLAPTLMAAAVTDTRLPDAAMEGDMATVQQLLTEGVSVDAAQGDGMTALHWAASREDLSMTALLLKSKANVNARTRINGVTPLFMAARKGNAAIIEALLNAGADIQSRSTVGTTPLMMTAASGNADAVRVLLNAGADPDAKDLNQGETALMFAAASGRTDVIRVLAQRGANLNVRSLVPTRLPREARPGNPAAVNAQATQQAASRGAPPPERPLALGGMTAMHFAVREGYIDTVRSLVESGADVNVPTTSDQSTILLVAITNGRYDIAKYLLEHGADPKPSNTEQATALFTTLDVKWAPHGWYPAPSLDNESTDYLELMKLLLDKGADVDARMSGRMTRIVGPAGGTVYNGETPFIRAAQANDVEAMKLLLARGANPTIPNNKGVTALMFAAGTGLRPSEGHAKPDSRLASVRFLVEEVTADVNAKDNDGFTPLHGAASVGDKEVIQYLVARGADVKARSNIFAERNVANAPPPKPGAGETVADMANGPGEKTLIYPDAVDMLIRLGSEFSDNCRSALCVNKSRDPVPATQPETKKPEPAGSQRKKPNM
jgi:ankyrin repeat protein